MAEGLGKEFGIENKVFLVTGGAAGIGAGIVRALLIENAQHVVFLDILEREGALLEFELLNNFGALKAKFIKCDISEEGQLAVAYKQVIDKYRRLDGVINSAAVLSVDDRSYKRMVDINFTATVNSTMTGIQVIGKDHGGSGGIIINLSSLLALNISNHLPVYAATKTAVMQFSVAMGSEDSYAKSKVRVVTVCLGPTDTAILDRNQLLNFESDSERISSRAAIRQKVESAVSGILHVIKKAKSGSTWIVKGDQPAYDYTEHITEAYKILSETYQ